MAAQPEAPAALELRDLAKGFGRGASRVVALDGIDLAVAPGSITGLLGPDGAGKTTLLRLAAGLLRPDRGEVRMFGRDMAACTRELQQDIGYMPQRFGLYDELSVRENLELYADLQGMDHQLRQQRFADLLRLTALGPFGSRRAGNLSGGMRQKLGLACALLRAPRVLLLDEPTVGVDPISRRELWHIIRAMREQGATVLVSTAYLDEAEACDELKLLHQGRMLAQGTPQSFRAPLRERCYRVRHAQQSRRALQASLQQRAGVVDALVQAAGVRVVLAPGTAPPIAAQEQWERAEPRFEDAFVAVLRDQGQHAVPAVPVPALGHVPAGDDAAAPVIAVQGLRRSFGSFEAVKGIDFEVGRGEVFGLLGANGAGKSTTFRMLCGLLPPSAGRVQVAGLDLAHAPAQARTRIGYVAQRFALYANLTVAQNLEFFASAYGLSGERRRQRLQWARREFELDAVARGGAGDLAQGFRQRLALACALMHEPQILFLDEPTSGVDPLARREFWQRINALAQSGVTVLVTTHFMDEAEYCDRLVLMSLGEILASGTPEQIRDRVRSPSLPEPGMEDAFVELIQAHEADLRREAA